MKISVFGLGYVGTVVCACLARAGHQIIGVDTDPSKVQLIQDGKSPIVEKDVEPMISEAVQAGRLTATLDASEAVRLSEISMIAVGTPSSPNGELDLAYVERVSQQIGEGLKGKAGRHLIVVRSTMLPGSVEGTVIPALEKGSGLKVDEDFGVTINPEFLRESTAVQDFYHPPKTVVGFRQEEDAETVLSLYADLPGPKLKVSLRVAEMAKYCDNIFHALKIVFGNEVGALCKALGVNAYEVMSVFCQDTKLNLSPAYLKPGFAFGGSCLPKDVRAMTRAARNHDVSVPLLNSLLPSNEETIQAALRLIQAQPGLKIGILGFAFKGGTDDLRESPVVTVIEHLLGKGCDLLLFDDSVSLARLTGANRKFLEGRIPHISRLMRESLQEVVDHADTLILGNLNPAFFQAVQSLGPEKVVIDLTHQSEPPTTGGAAYHKLCGF